MSVKIVLLQELVKLTIMDLCVTVASTIVTDFLRAVFVRYGNQCWCWDLEKGFVSIVVSVPIYIRVFYKSGTKEEYDKKDIKGWRDVV